MKLIFAIGFLCLVLAGVITYRLMPESRSKLPILYWATDPNPARKLQIAAFHEWLEKNGHPKFELKIDTANNLPAKIVIQGVSGVAADLFDTYIHMIDYYVSIGLLKDVTDDAKKLGFAPGKTYPALLDNITVQGRQFTFPCNVGGTLFWINKTTFEKYGQPIPPPRWTAEEFEKAGIAFMEKANEGSPRREVFFANGVSTPELVRSTGLDVYNETLTACALDDPRHAKVLKLIYKWRNDDHIIPTAAEASSFAAESGYGGSDFQLFNSGNFGMVFSGRHALIQFRKFGSINLGITEPPHLGYPVTEIRTRAAAVYAGGKNQDLAKYFQAFLASKEYNMTIVKDSDGLPPNPEFAKSEEFMRPKEYPNEWGCHEMFFRDALNTAVPFSRSPFVLKSISDRHIEFYRAQFMNDRITADDAGRLTVVRLNEEIERSLRENPKLQPLYNERMEIQKKIEAYRRDGRKVPLSWLFNPFHRKYYRDMGWVEEDSK